LQDILHYLYKWIYGAKDAKNAETRLCLGSFSYLKSNVISTTNVNEADSTKLSEKIVDKDGKVLRQFSNTRHYANMGDIPISIKSFASWYSNKIIDGDIQKMSFHDLLKEIMYVLVPQNIEPRIFPWGPSVSFDPFIIYETIPKVEEIEKWIFTSHTVKQADLQKSPWVNFSKYKTLKTTKIQEEDSETINYIFLTSKMEVNEKLKGNAKEDINNNIPHFYVGEEKGLIKNIKFKREDNKQLDAANIIKANKEQTTPKIIRQIYQLEMSMFGNTIFYPGNLIHISPSYPGSKLFSKTLYKIGLGGYYRIIRINHNIGSDGFTTNVEAKWETSGIESLNEEQKITEEITEETAQQTAQSTETPEMKQIRELG